jgi:hypothetical protein
MKAKIRYTAMLISMIISTLAVSAQSAARNNLKVQERPARTVETREHKSISTRHHPESDYRSANRTVYVNQSYKDPKQSSRTVRQSKSRTYANNTHQNSVHINRNKGHYHYYPHKKVKIKLHPTTYHHHYKVAYYPAYRDITWTRSMYRTYINLYPGYKAWHYPIGYRIQTISAFEAKYNLGEVSRVYGRVYASWHNKETDDILLFFGGQYPHQEFTMVVPGHIARRFSWRPERYFLGQHVYATGLITSFEGKAEMVVKKKSQIDLY